jgi:hypothetical protein
MPARSNKYVGRLDIAMDDARAVGGVKGVRDLDLQIKQQLGG